MDRAPDNFLKQGVADASLEAKGVFLQNPEVFHTLVLHKGVLEIANLVLGERKMLPTIGNIICRHCI